MHAKLIILLAVLFGAWMGLRWFMRTPPEKAARMLRQGALYGGIALLVLLAVSGRLHWLFAALAAAVPLVQRAFGLLRLFPMLRRLAAMVGVGIPGAAGAGSPPGQASTVTTDWLRMSLDHASGEMDGVVLRGAYEGRRLADLDTAEVVELLAACGAEDPQSAAVLEAYLDRSREADWRERFAAGRQAGGDPGAAPSQGEMTEQEAFEILGLEPGASSRDVRDAHRRLMQRFHPDRGGSGYLATLINRAKEILMARAAD